MYVLSILGLNSTDKDSGRRFVSSSCKGLTSTRDYPDHYCLPERKLGQLVAESTPSPSQPLDTSLWNDNEEELNKPSNGPRPYP
jgi:hypothetical protein